MNTRNLHDNRHEVVVNNFSRDFRQRTMWNSGPHFIEGRTTVSQKYFLEDELQSRI
jgi:predicted metal-dependent HD superfamily phosphohydrolase